MPSGGSFAKSASVRMPQLSSVSHISGDSGSASMPSGAIASRSCPQITVTPLKFRAANMAVSTFAATATFVPSPARSAIASAICRGEPYNRRSPLISNTTVPGPVISNTGAKDSATPFSSVAVVVRWTQANILCRNMFYLRASVCICGHMHHTASLKAQAEACATTGFLRDA